MIHKLYFFRGWSAFFCLKPKKHVVVAFCAPYTTGTWSGLGLMRPSLQPMDLRFADVSAVKPDECQCQDDLVTVDKGLEIGKIGNTPRGISWCFWVRKKSECHDDCRCLHTFMYIYSIYIHLKIYIYGQASPCIYTYIHAFFCLRGDMVVEEGSAGLKHKNFNLMSNKLPH